MNHKLLNCLSKKTIAFSIIGLATLIIYANSFSSPFILDDFGSIANNYDIRNPLNLAAIWNFYSNRFIIYLTFSINFFIHQTQVEGYHIVNIGIHIINGILVYEILKLLLSLKTFEKKVIIKYKNVICLMAALIFISHPVQVNAVTYIVQRTAALAATFYFLSIYYYMKYRLGNKSKHFYFTLLFILLAMFTKENTITIPFMLILIEFMFFFKNYKCSWKKTVSILLILLLTVPIIPCTNLFLGGYSQSDPAISFKASTSMDRFQYFYTEMNVILHYIKDLVLPNHLNFDYSNDYPLSQTMWDHHSYLSFVILLLIGIFALFQIKRNPLISLGIFWFYIGLAVESSFLSIKDVYFEHRLYFPVVGFILCSIGIIFYEKNKTRNKYLFKNPGALLIVSFSFFFIMFSMVTLQRNYTFSDKIRLWTDVTFKAPFSDRAYCILGSNYLDVYNEKVPEGKIFLEKAETNLKKSLELNYSNNTARCNLSKVYLYKEEYEKCIEEANRVPNSKYALYNAGKAYEGLNKKDKAITSYLQGLKIDKQCTFLLSALGELYYEINDFKNAQYYLDEFKKYNLYSLPPELEEIIKKLDQKKIRDHK